MHTTIGDILLTFRNSLVELERLRVGWRKCRISVHMFFTFHSLIVPGYLKRCILYILLNLIVLFAKMSFET